MDKVRMAVKDNNYAWYAANGKNRRMVHGVFTINGHTNYIVGGVFYFSKWVKKGWYPKWLPFSVSSWISTKLNRRLVRKQQNALSFLKEIGTLQPYQRTDPVLEPYYEDYNTNSFTQIVIDMELLADEIVKHIVECNDAVYYLYRRECERVIVGRDIAAKLMGDPHFMSFQVPATFDRVVHRSGYGNLRIDGLMIQVVPWFNGVLVVPSTDN